MQDPRKLWSGYGLRSLSKQDVMYAYNDFYWTGPVWININYLVLRGLKLYYSHNEEAKKMYKKLRNDLINTVCVENWEKRGFFYENYNRAGNGLGEDGHPFSGWTSLIALIVSENY